MRPVLQLGDTNNWDLTWSDERQATEGAGRKYIPIPEIVVPVIFENHWLAVLATSLTAKPSWNFAGFLVQKVRLGLVVGGGYEAAGTQKRKIWLDQVTLIQYQRLTPDYVVAFQVPKWIAQINLTVWQYTGIDSDTLSQQLVIIESKIDSLL